MDIWRLMMKTSLLTLVGVAWLGVAIADQSEPPSPDNEPMESLENSVGERRVATPQVVLQLKYDRGELNKIYLAQFRKERESWIPSVPARTNLCADLCHAGLGGSACGRACSQMLPVGLETALQAPNDTRALYGEPRVAVCPSLCRNGLGSPLCSCGARPASSAPATVDWSGVCAAFCRCDGYVLGGCPPCDQSNSISSEELVTSSRILNTDEGWRAWCNLQCRQGHGGAACNCDRSPLQ